MRTVSTDTTFLIQSQVPVQAKPRESPFGKHMMRPADRQIISHKEFQPGWIFGILIGTTLILTWLVFFYRKRMIQLIYSGFSRRNLSQLIREGDPFKERITLALSMVYVMMIALLLLQTNMDHLI